MNSNELLKPRLARQDTQRGVVENPFTNQSRWTTYERVKTVLMTISCLPLVRLILALFFFFLMVFFGALATLGHGSSTKPLASWRRALFHTPMRLLARAILFCFGYHWISVKKPSSQSTQPAKIIVANHVTMFDGMVFAFLEMPCVAVVSFMAKVPVLGTLIRSFQPILVDNRSVEGRERAKVELQERPRSGEWPPLLIFPEGTTKCGDYLTTFKTGTFLAGLPVQPVCCKWSYSNVDPCWTGPIGNLELLWRLCCQPWNTLSVEYLPVYQPTQAEIDDPPVYAHNVRKVMAVALDAKVVSADSALPPLRPLHAAPPLCASFSPTLIYLAPPNTYLSCCMLTSLVLMPPPPSLCTLVGHQPCC
jgi:1-acyl-sn-glycerol-3-phosphate acyltransferase